MQPAGSPSGESGIDLPPLAAVGRYRTAAEASERGLVVLAMRLPYWLMPVDDGYLLMVEAEHAEPVADQLRRYELENRRWPPEGSGGERLHPIEGAVIASLLWALATMIVFALQERAPGRLEAAGMLDPRALFSNREWWRPWTALLLHADPEHLGANLLCGLIVFTALGALLGVIRGWILLVLSAGLANVLAAAIHYPGEVQSLGASTAIFAALGLMAGRGLRRAIAGRTSRPIWLALAPLAAASVLFELGAGGPHIDVIAHGSGILMGAVWGALAAA